MRLFLLSGWILLIAGCIPTAGTGGSRPAPLTSVERDSLFAHLESAPRASYGHSPYDPVRLGHFGTFKGIQASYWLLSRLRKDGQPLRVLMRGTGPIDPPADTSLARPGPDIHPPFTGIMDAYVLVTANTGDTLRLYFDAYYAAPVYLPQGLTVAETPAE